MIGKNKYMNLVFTILFLFLEMAYINAQNGFVIGINTSENRTKSNGLTITDPMKPSAPNNYSSIYGCTT